MRPEGSPSGLYQGRNDTNLIQGITSMTQFKAVICFCFILSLATVISTWGFDGVDVASIKKMAAEGNADAQSKLGVLYSSGVGMKMDKKEAVKWYRKSAAQGNPVGEWNLAFMYVRGEGVEADFTEARKLFHKAAENGFANAQYDLGMMLLQGLGGKQDQAEAENWFRVAAGQGYREAEKILKELHRQ
jgi:TPR repeat protein